MKFKADRIKLGIMILIIGLVLVLIAFENGFKERIKLAVLPQNNITSLKKFEAVNGRITYKLPSEWSTTTQKFPGNEIIYHNDFISQDSKIHGFVQVWNGSFDAKTFIEKSKNAAFKEDTFYGYDVSNTKINNKNAYLVKYSVKSKDYGEYAAREYYIDFDNNKFFRIAFYVRKVNYTQNMDSVFEAIASTITIK